MGTAKEFDFSAVGGLADAIKSYVVTMVEQADKQLNEDGVYNLEGGDFSITCSGAAFGYPIAVQFGMESCDAMIKEAVDMVDKLGHTVKTYRKAEDANTAK